MDVLWVNAVVSAIWSLGKEVRVPYLAVSLAIQDR